MNAVDSMYERLNKKIAYKIKDYNQSPDDNGAPHVASINLELKKQEISDIQCVNEPDISSSHAIEICNDRIPLIKKIDYDSK